MVLLLRGGGVLLRFKHYHCQQNWWSQPSSYIIHHTHIMMMGFRLGEAEACKVPNCALFCVSSCTKSCFSLRFVVLRIVLFSAFRRAPNRVFFCGSSCSKSCFFSAFRRATKIVLFSAFRRAPNRAFFLRFVVLQIVLFSAFRRAPNRAFFCVSPCSKSCFFLRLLVRQTVLFPHSPFHIAASVPPCLIYYNVGLLAKTLGLAL